ncbi:hypothetical protein HTZ77_02075 [Nonomuraea sp. SMC257]|uniref:Uncharacterized protein n=1 Tax=Nonomuraea montanisoli TaxID=2741721 RepID=A0A7Y6I3R5_9ACTN|nr:hypothetical protein [Nonomuraea montanisoli]NUW30220.1 hypothetical protein [Nonomuraea montanisoli]
MANPANGSNDAFGALSTNGALNGLTAGAVSRVSFTEGKLASAGKGLDQQKDTLSSLDGKNGGLGVPWPHFSLMGMGVNTVHEKAITTHNDAGKLAQESLDSWKRALYDSDANYTGAGSDTMQQINNGLGNLGGLGDMSGLKNLPGPGGLPDLGGKGLPDLNGDGIPDVDVNGDGIPDKDLNGDGIPDVDLNGDGIPDVDVNGDGIPDKDLNGDGIPDVDLNGDGIPDSPKTNIPKMPSTDLPKMPSTDLPKMPSTDLPNGPGGVDTKVPDINSALNGQRMPDMSGINTKVPTGTELSDYQAPQVRTPDMSALNADPNSVARAVNPVQTSTSPGTSGGTFNGGGANAAALQAGLRSATAGLTGSGMPMAPMMPMSPPHSQDQSGDSDDKYGLRAEESVWGGDDPTAPTTIGVDT